MSKKKSKKKDKKDVKKDLFDEEMGNPAVRLAFEQDWLQQEFVAQLRAHMEKEGLTRKKLADRLGKTPAAITQALREGQNLTLHSMVEIADAAGLRLCLSLAPTAEMPMPKSMTS